jgi:hypothetical protein
MTVEDQLGWYTRTDSIIKDAYRATGEDPETASVMVENSDLSSTKPKCYHDVRRIYLYEHRINVKNLRIFSLLVEI